MDDSENGLLRKLILTLNGPDDSQLCGRDDIADISSCRTRIRQLEAEVMALKRFHSLVEGVTDQDELLKRNNTADELRVKIVNLRQRVFDTDKENDALQQQVHSLKSLVESLEEELREHDRQADKRRNEIYAEIVEGFMLDRALQENLDSDDFGEALTEPVGALYIMDDKAVDDYEIQCANSDEQSKEDLDGKSDDDSIPM